jgi:hypothetical protein
VIRCSSLGPVPCKAYIIAAAVGCQLAGISVYTYVGVTRVTRGDKVVACHVVGIREWFLRILVSFTDFCIVFFFFF